MPHTFDEADDIQIFFLLPNLGCKRGMLPIWVPNTFRSKISVNTGPKSMCNIPAESP